VIQLTQLATLNLHVIQLTQLATLNLHVIQLTQLATLNLHVIQLTQLATLNLQSQKYVIMGQTMTVMDWLMVKIRIVAEAHA
jgi:hypothetical protein